ncbi:PAS domain S-box protein, partial [Candidatus Calescamantes bacterium]|nr:PAS domain S-box protein [Candidatus Calescamantes bacterium]
ENLDEAYDFLRSKPVDIVILDPLLKKVTFEEVNYKLREYLNNLTFVGVVREERVEWEEELERMGVKIWIKPPFTLKNVRRTLTLAEERIHILRELSESKKKKKEKNTIAQLPKATFPPLPTYPYYQETIRKFSKALTYMLDLPRLIDLVITAFSEIFEVNKIAILMKTKNGKGYHIESSMGLIEEQIKGAIFYKHRGIFEWLSREGRLLHQAEDELPDSVEKEMLILNAEVVLPLEIKGNLLGAITVGKKITGEKFDMEDLRLLYTMANYAAVALHNALLYREINSQSQHFQFILESLPSGFLFVDEEGKITRINKKAREILGITEDITGASIQKVGSILSDLFLRTLKEAREANREEVYLPGEKRTLGVTTSLIKDREGKVKGAVMFFRDLTPLKVKERKEKNQEEENLWKLIAERVAHEVRNPLVSIKTFSQLLPEKYLDMDFRDEFSHMVIEEVDRLSIMLDLLEKFAHPGEPIKTLESVNEIIEEVLLEFQRVANEKNIKITTRFDSSYPMVEVDRNQISEAVFQVIKNSFQTLKDGGKLNITTTVDSDRKRVQIKIKDYGEGIPLENLKKVFLPLFTTRFRGLGLGLPLVKKIIEGHGGRVEIDSWLGKGTEVSLYLPLSSKEKLRDRKEEKMKQEVKIEEFINS